jgi:ectoine hydroxylase-related dioxygenase (phytanoyl-CoA dioxygenase family)
MAATEIDGHEPRVVECTGRAGDVYLTHPWLFHTIATNASRRPRPMRSFAVFGGFMSVT